MLGLADSCEAEFRVLARGLRLTAGISSPYESMGGSFSVWGQSRPLQEMPGLSDFAGLRAVLNYVLAVHRQ